MILYQPVYENIMKDVHIALKKDTRAMNVYYDKLRKAISDNDFNLARKHLKELELKLKSIKTGILKLKEKDFEEAILYLIDPLQIPNKLELFFKKKFPSLNTGVAQQSMDEIKSVNAKTVTKQKAIMKINQDIANLSFEAKYIDKMEAKYKEKKEKSK